MKHLRPVVLILWGQGFDEIAASIFVGELRRLAVSVKVVGLNQHTPAGQHGLALVPDLTLGQALRLAGRVTCIVVPATLASLQQFSYDPRLAELMRIAVSNGTRFVAADSLSNSNHVAEAMGLSASQVTDLPIWEELAVFVQALARSFTQDV